MAIGRMTNDRRNVVAPVAPDPAVSLAPDDPAHGGNRMPKVETETRSVCADCVYHQETGDHCEFNRYFEFKQWKTRNAEIIEACNRQETRGVRWLSVDPDPSDEFSRRPCEWCGSRLHGQRYRAIVEIDERNELLDAGR